MGRSLEITTVIGCQNNCSYCPQNKLIKAYSQRSNINRLSLADFKKFLAQVGSHVHIKFSGFCEPWSNPECSAMIVYAHTQGHVVSVYTTTIGMKYEAIDQIKLIPFKNFVVHLPDGSGQTLIKVDDDYLLKLEKLLEYKISNLQFICQNLFASDDIDQSIKNLLEKYHNFNKTKLFTKPTTRAGNIKLKPLSDSLQITGQLGQCIKFDSGVLVPNGDVFLCCVDFGLKHCLGNLNNNSLAELFNSPEIWKIKKGFQDESIDILCRHCELAVKKGLTDNLFLKKYIYLYLRSVRNFFSVYYNKFKSR